MKPGNITCTILFLLFSLMSVYSQNSIVDLNQIDLETVDFSEARLSVAGPGAFLIRGVLIEGEVYSVIFRESNGSWVVEELIAETGDPILPSNVVLDFATVTVTESGLRIDGIIIDGKTYSTTLTLNDNSLVVPSGLSAAKLVGGSLSRIGDDAGLFTQDELNNQTARIASLTERNTQLIAAVGDLTLDLDLLTSENEVLNIQLDQLKEEKEVLSSEVANLQNRVGELSSALAEAESEIDSMLAAVGTEEGDASANADGDTSETDPEQVVPEAVDGETPVYDLLLVRIEVLLDKISLLEDQIQNLETELARVSLPASVSTGSVEADLELSDSDALTRIRTLQAEVSHLRIENSRLSAERNEIEQEIRREFLDNGYIATMYPELSEVRQRGFSTSETQLGSWELSESMVMEQTDPSEFFAKLELPIPQDERPTLYSFEGRSRGAGWAGFGIHIFADAVEKRGYGYGESLLIWFTRDPRHYGNNRTYLEIYRSSDDINMARVLSAAIPEEMDEWMDVDLLYQPGDEYITVAVNGVEKVRYKTWFSINWGVEMALRTLDVAEFRNLEVRTTAGEIDFP